MSQWYFNKNLKPQGPLDFEEMKKKIRRGEIGPSDLILREGERSFLPAIEWREFPAETFPAFQKNYFKIDSPSEKEWIFLRFNLESPQGAQEGPYSVEDLKQMLRDGEASLEDYIWRTGLTGWVQIKDRPEFTGRPTSPVL